jgi:hypothetical protein
VIGSMIPGTAGGAVNAGNGNATAIERLDAASPFSPRIPNPCIAPRHVPEIAGLHLVAARCRGVEFVRRAEPHHDPRPLRSSLTSLLQRIRVKVRKFYAVPSCRIWTSSLRKSPLRHVPETDSVAGHIGFEL